MCKKVRILISLFLIISSFNSLSAATNGMDRLIQGNQRFVRNESEHPNRSIERRQKIAPNQKPFAVIVACSDSRVAPEIVFDQGLGDLFVVRVAGNVIGQLELESIEYAVFYLNASVILVLGHENCGAVNAVVNGTTKDIEALAALIKPSVDFAKSEKSKNLLEASIKANAIKMRDQLLKMPAIRQLAVNGKLNVQAGYYHLREGNVEVLK